VARRNWIARKFHHENTKRRKHERKDGSPSNQAHLFLISSRLFRDFVFSYFRVFVMEFRTFAAEDSGAVEIHPSEAGAEPVA